MFPEFKFFGEVTSMEVKATLDAGILKFKEFINKQKIIRCFIPGGPGYGHETASINIIRRFCDTSAQNPMGCNYAGKIEIFVNVDDITAKILELIPEMLNRTTGRLNAATIEIKNIIDEPPDTDVDFGFCGACDYINGDPVLGFLEDTFLPLRTKCFLMLQPYKWFVKAYARNGLSPGNLIFYRKVVQSDLCVFCVNLDTGKELLCRKVDTYPYSQTNNFYQLPPLHVAERSFFTPIYNLTSDNWDTIRATVPVDIQRLLTILQTLTNEGNLKKYSIVPVYGVNFPSKTNFRTPVSNTLALTMASFQTALRNGAIGIIKPPIIINFSPYNPGENEGMTLQRMLQLANGSTTTFENFAKLLLDTGWAEEGYVPYFMKVMARAKARQRSLGSGDYYLLADYKNIPDLSQLTRWLDGNEYRVLFIQANRVPSIVFNYVLKASGLLPIFEGQNTAVPAIMTGKPYFHTVGVGEIGKEINYTSGSVGDKNAAALIKYLQLTANQIQEDFSEWPLNADAAPNKVISDFINSAYKDKEVTDYFGSVKEFFESPINDKINTGTAIVANYFPYMLLRNVGDEFSALEELYNAIKEEIESKGMVDLLGTILTTGGIHDYFSAILKIYSGQLIIKQATVEAHRNGDNQIDQVILKGTTEAFSILTNSSFVFEFQMNDLSCSADFVATETWSLDGIPWIVFEIPAFHVLVSDGDLPPSGRISGILKGADIELSLTVPDSYGRSIGTGTFEQPASISKFLAFVGGIDLIGMIPEPIRKLANIGVKSVQFVYNSQLNSVETITLTIGSTESWSILERLVVENVNVEITVLTPGDLKNRKTSAAFSGDLLIGTDENAPRITISAAVPGLKLNGQLDSPELPLNQLLAVFWPGASPAWPGGNEPSITELSVSYDSTTSEYIVSSGLELNWPITVGGKDVLTIKSISIYFAGGKGWSTGSLSGSIIILPDSANVGLLLTAMYLGNGAGWRFQAEQTSGQVSLLSLIKEYFGWETDFDVKVDGLSLQVETATNSWLFTGKTAEPIQIPGVDVSLDLNLKLGYNGGTQSFGGRETIIGKAIVPVLLSNRKIVSLESIMQMEATQGYFGTGQADISWQNIDLTVYYDFAPGNKDFGIKWGPLEGKITQSGDPQKTKATLQFTESTTVGSMVETMVGWATGSKFSLGAPWNILDSIALNNLTLTFNFTEKQVGLEIDLNTIEIGLLGINIATITGFNLSYNSGQSDPKQNGVQVQLLGTFNWPRDGKKTDDPLGWDASKPETTPGPPALGNKYLDLRLLAMGQHVEVKDLDKATSVEQAITLMKNLPEPDPNKLPPLTVNPNNGWLVGLDLGLLRIDQKSSGSINNQYQLPTIAGNKSNYVFNLQIVFSDPNLYGLRIKMDGDAAKVFKGLVFEIMYRQISQSVGVYQSEITLPDVMRYIRMGQFNITLPVFGIQVYTNGDFQVDLGFPWNANFARSFTLQTIIYVPVPIPVMGSIGLYFAKLSSATTTKVPSTKKGIFNPVIAFGVGFQIGLGYDFNIGVLSAGFQLTAFAIIEGVIAKWNPYLPAIEGVNDRIEEDYYFAITGTLGLIGKLYGSVDFAIIKASINIEINVMAQFYFAPYEQIEISLVANVRASASIKILFITIHFSFSISVQHHLTLPSISTGVAPWYDGTEKISLVKSRRLERAAHASRLLQLYLAKTITPKWDNLLPAQTQSDLQSYIMFAVTVARDENEAVPTLANQMACGVSMLMIESVKAPQEDLISCKEKASDPSQDSAFEKLAKQIFRWMIAAMQTEAKTEAEVDEIVVTREDLEALLNYLSDKDRPIPEEAINTFMEQQFRMEVNVAQNSIDATYFPMAPYIGFSIKGTNYTELAYTYEQYNSSSSDYLSALRAYFSELEVKTLEKEIKGYTEFSLSDSQNPSVASFVFTDYFSLIAKQMLQMAVNSLKNFVYNIQPGQKNSDIVNWVNTTGKFSDYTLEKLFEDNKEHKLNPGKTIAVSGVAYTVQSGSTFESISTGVYTGAFTAQSLANANVNSINILNAGIAITYPEMPAYTTLPGQSLKSIADAIGVNVDDLINKSNLTRVANLLIAPSKLALPDFNYSTNNGDTLTSICSAIGTTLEHLSSIEANASIVDLFATADSATLNIVQLSQFKVSELIKEIQYTQGLQHLAGLTSRCYMAGLRLPTKGLTPNYPGMWVKGNAGAYGLPETAGLLALTGQQVPVLKLSGEENLTLTFTNYLCNWIIFQEGSPFTITINKDSTQNKQITTLLDYATSNYLDVGLIELGSQELFTLEPSTYTFNSAISWVSPSPINMPYAQNAGDPQSLKAWKIPDSLLNLPDLSVHEINPSMVIQLGTYDEATQTMQQAPFNNYAWGTRIDFSIKKISPVPGSPTTETTYELVGADGFNTLLLEKMVAQIGSNESLISSFHIAYAQESDDTAGAGVQTDDSAYLTIGLAQVNLTTVTQPGFGTNEDAQLTKLQNLTSSTEFIRLLWEASITQQGGYYLYYYNNESKTGLPDRIFDNNGDAEISLMVLFSNVQANQVCSYMNVLVTASQVDFSAHTLFAKTLMRNWEAHVADSSLNDIANAYFSDIDEIVEKNKTLPLRNGAVMTIKKGLYKVGTKAPGANPDDIAIYFGTTTDALKTANPLITVWTNPLPLYTPLFLPDLPLNMGTSKGGNTFYDIAQYYNTSLSGIAIANGNVKGVFNTETTVQFSTGPLTNTATVTQGEMAIEALRVVPPPIPDNPDADQYAKIYLKNNFSLLGYKISGNPFFNESNMAIPLCPVIKDVSPTGVGKFIAPPVLQEGDEWAYKDSLPYTGFVKKLMRGSSNLPDPENSPYKGIGSLLQIEYSWQDLYGNSLLTTLDDSSSVNNLNEFPILIRYTDSLVGPGKWPSVNMNWQILKVDDKPTLNLIFNFDAQAYNGLLKAIVSSDESNTVNAIFTDALDAGSATNVSNYSFDAEITILSLSLNADTKSVKIVVDKILADVEISLKVKGVLNADKSQTYSGTAGFSTNPDIKPTSTLITKATGDKSLYEKAWYQLNDGMGIQLRADTTVVPASGFVLDAGQTNRLVQTWLGSIYLFVANRAGAMDTVAAPNPQQLISFIINETEVETKDIFQLKLNFSIRRKKPDLLAGSTADILESVTAITPLPNLGDDAKDSYTQFVNDFESAFSAFFELRVASGIDRFASQVSGVSPLWAVRLNTNPGLNVPAIGYKINADTAPKLFSPRPVSNQLISRTNVPIYPFKTDTGIDYDHPTFKDFIDTDVNLWCNQVFENFDDLLSPQYTAAIQIVDYRNKVRDPLSVSYFDKLTDQKDQLVDIIKKLMVPVFRDEAGIDAGAIRESFKQALLVKLSNAYNIKSGLQFSANVFNNNLNDAAYLFGNVNQTAAKTVQNIQFTSPKLSLETNANAAFNFLLSAPQIIKGEKGEVLSSLSFDLLYAATSIEHQIGELPGIKDYKASSWLKFFSRESSVLAAQPLYNNPIEVPLPLNIFPTAPGMTGQYGKLSDKINYLTLSDLLNWDYQLTYSQIFHYPQDTLHFTVQFNVLLDKDKVDEGWEDAFDDIAEMISVLPTMKGAFDNLAKINTESGSQEIKDASVAVSAYSTMVDKIIQHCGSEGLSIRKNPDPAFSNSDGPYYFSVQESVATVDTTGGVLLVSVGISNDGETALGGVPLVSIEGYTTVFYNKDCKDGYCYYNYYFTGADSNFLMAVIGQAIPKRTITLSKLSILARQDVYASVAMDRNSELVAGRPTNTEFVYTTGEVKFPNYYYPNFAWNEPINMACIPSGKPVPATIETHLNNLFDSLLQKNEQSNLSFKVVCTYNYPVNALDNRIQLPVMMQPVKTFTLSNPHKAPDGMINSWTSVVKKWLQQNTPNSEDAKLNFDLSVFSNLTEEPKPLVQLRGLYLEMIDILT